MKRNLQCLAAALLLAATTVGCDSAPEVYNPTYGEGYYVLTPALSDSPRINGPELFGVRPSAPFQYAVPVSGKQPIEITVDNLPEGLSIDSKTGIISGLIKSSDKKTYTINITAKNSVGEVSEPFDIVVGEDICLTPPMGWSSWIATKRTLSQAKVMLYANEVKRRGLDKLGYSYINIDDCWQGAKRSGKFHAIEANPVTFPDIKGMVDTLHSMGFKAGIYSTPWISSYAKFIGGSSNNKDGYWDESMVFDKQQMKVEGSCSIIGKYRFDENDAKQWAEWGFDYMKYDWNPNDSASVLSMATALRNSGRDIAFSISNSCPISLAKYAGELVQVIRTNGDIRARWDAEREHINLVDNWNYHIKWLEEGTEAKPGHIPDPDFLMIGLQKYGANDSLTVDELYHHMSSFALFGGPLLLSCPITEMNDFEQSLLTNVELLDINQDRLAASAKRLYNKDGIEVLVKPLSNGDKAIGIFNFNDTLTTATIDWETMGLEGDQMVRDVWRQQNIGKYNGSFSTVVRPHGVVVIRTTAK